MRKLVIALALVASAVSLSACVVEGPRPPGCYWVPGHYGPEGGWHPGHCR